MTDGAYTGQETYEYLNTGTYDAPTWSRIARVGDVSLPSERGTTGFATKESDQKKYLAGVQDRSVAFTYTRKKGDDAVYEALKAAHDAGNASCVDFLALDGPAATIGSKGHRGPYLVTKFNEDRKHESEVTVEVELKPADAIIPGGSAVWDIVAFEVTV